uniref:Putative OSA1 n=1 Tax=Reticulitermes speratus TaxID=60591 RepID=A0A347ZJA3_9NEOP
MEKEKNEITSETKEGCVSEADMKHSGDDKPVLEALMLNVTTGHEGIIGKSEVVKEENNSNNLSLKKAEGEREVNEGVSSQDDNKDPTVDCHEVPADVHVQLEEKNVTVQSTKATPIGCIESKSDTAGVKNGETTEVTSTNDNALPTEDKVPVSTCQSSELSQAITSVGGSCNNGTSTLSTVSTTRSTRSQNPEFLARHRSFLHKLHLASSNNITDEELFTDDDESTTSKTTSRSSGSVQAEETSSLIVDSLTVRRKRERSASNGTLSPRIPSPSVSSMIGGSASANNSGSSSPAGSQMQPATKKRRSTRTDSAGAQQQQSPVATPLPAVGSSTDQFCWLCHKDGVVINCETCPRVYHLRCIQLEAAPTEDWVCPECITILHAENTDTRSRAMKLLSLDQLCNLLKYAVSRMKTYSGAEPFWKAVDVTEFPQYRDYVANPMDLSLLERNIKKRMYGSTEAFVADTKWILHNCIIFNTYQSRLTGIAKVLLKICKQEMSEIENCPDCYLNAHIRKDSWFIEVCRKPHILVWAKLKGFPFWPAKVMRTNKEGMVDVRFFGAHDRAWVPVRECFLYSKAIPASARNKKRNNLDACIEEVEQHTRKLREKFGVFEHAPFRTHFDPSREREQLHMLLPSYDDGGGQPSSKRSKLLGGGYTVRTYQRSQQSNREAQERKKIKTYETEELNATVERDKSVDRSSRTKKRNLWDGDGCSDNEKRASRSYKRTASGSSMSWQNSSTSCSNSSSSSSSDVGKVKKELDDDSSKTQSIGDDKVIVNVETSSKSHDDQEDGGSGLRIRDPAGTLKRRRMSDYEDECYTRDEASLYLVTETQDSLARRCVCLSNILRNLTFVPGNEVEFAKNATFLGLLGKLLLLHHEHPTRTHKQRNYDREEDADFADSCSSLQGESEWWWDFLHHIRENVLVTAANIAGHMDLGQYPEEISRPVLDGLLHWAVCPAAHGQDPFPTVGPSSPLSPQRLALEALCKLCVTDSNVDLVIATPPYSRLERLCAVLTKLLCRSEEQVLREFAVNLLHYLAAADSGMARTVALQSPCVSLLVAFIEQAEASALGVANQHGISALRENPDSMGTSLDMLRRAAGTLLHLARHPDNRPLFLQQEQRLLALVMSQILDQQVASIISRVLFQCSRPHPDHIHFSSLHSCISS